jgi:formylaminopyrimidine deformylase / aminopyrimidine aminohydrolase
MAAPVVTVAAMTPATLRPARRVRAVPVADLPRRHARAWREATSHPFLAGVRDGTISGPAFDTWLVQDARFAADLLRFQARMLARAPRAAQAVLAAGIAALVEELDWFDRQAAARGLDLTAPALPATEAYAALLVRLDAADVPTALTALWAIERAYLDAWSTARPAARAYRGFVDRWTAPGFAGYVADLEAAADAAGEGSEEVFLAVAAAEKAFWDMATDAA